MGSFGMFHRSNCKICYRRRVCPPHYNHPTYENICRRCHKGGWAWIDTYVIDNVQVVEQALGPRTESKNREQEWLRTAGLHHLRCALLARRPDWFNYGPEGFHLFTYGSNGMAGNVNITTDIIDVILSFL